MTGLAFQLVWAIARLLLVLSWTTGRLVGLAIIAGVRFAAVKHAQRSGGVGPDRAGNR